MKKTSFEGVSRLPPGFRFEPTDEELLFQYLRCKIFSLPLPASVIPEVHYSKLDPWELPGDSMEEKYVFTQKVEKHRRRNQYNKATHSGYWKVITSSEEHIFPPSNLNLLGVYGLKRTLVYHFLNNGPTDWIMHEYSLAYMNSNVTSKKEDWIICHVFLNKRTMEEHDDDAIMLDYKFSSNNTSCLSSSSSSSSSSVAEISSNHESQSDEESSYFL
uniref:NAC6 n=1 Tax=Haloxylon ammodendron TaxID=151230 RepID=A0A1B1SHT6_9CARY|nr:NAC6 [Haloxylon ammodendron]